MEDIHITRSWVVTLCFIFGVAVTMATNPGLKLQISQNGLNYAATIAINQLASDVQGKTIPDLHGKDHVAIGKIEYDITGMRVTSFTRPTSSIVVHPGQGITWSLSNLGAAVHGDWRYKYRKAFIKISDHGNFDVEVKSTSLTVSIAMGLDSNGRPTISMTSCNCHIGDVKVKFHGGASWLYNLFDHVVQRPIEDKLRSLLCDSVKKAINVDAEKSLAKMKVRVPIEGLLTLDYRLVAAPVFGNNLVESQHKGEFMWTASETEAPFPAPPMGEMAGTQKMVTICLSDYVTNTLGYVIFKYGKNFLHYTLKKSDLPKDAQHFLDVKTIPPLAKKYPNGSIEVGMRVTASPFLRTTSDVIIGNFRGVMDFDVRLPNGQLGHGFSGDVNARLILAVTLTGEKVTAKVKQIKFQTNITKTEVGPIPDVVLEMVLSAAANGFIIPKLNEVGAKGLIIPGIDHVQIVEPELRLAQGLLCFTANAKYDPTLRFKPHSG